MAKTTIEYATPFDLAVLEARVAALEAGGGSGGVAVPMIAPQHVHNDTLLVSKLPMADTAPYLTVCEASLPDIAPGQLVIAMSFVHVDPRPDDKSRECATVTWLRFTSAQTGPVTIAQQKGNDLLYAKKRTIHRGGMYQAKQPLTGCAVSLQMRAVNLRDRGEARLSFSEIHAAVI